MRLTTLLLLAALVQVNARGIGQTVNYSARKVSLEKVFSVLKQQTGYVFFYNDNDVKLNTQVSVDFKNTPLREALTESLKNQPLQFQMKGKTIFITQKTAAEKPPVLQAAPPPPVDITGVVTDEKGKPIAGVTVMYLDKKGSGTFTDKEGRFKLTVASLPATITFSYVGFNSYGVTVKDPSQAALSIQLHINPGMLDSFVTVSTGVFTRKKESFTGAVSTFNNNQLQSVSNQNILTSLKTLDPSFIMMDNNLSGSNPNSLPSIQIRGQSGIVTGSTTDQFGSDPNEPLFILDGFITTLTIVNNLDINRVASVTLLKDAASTALYGAKASNGVVVIETRKPRAGRMRVSYSGDFNIQAPDLSGYNMMNSTEELQFEKLAGRYTYYDSSSYTSQYKLDQLYSKHLQAVTSGVNTYWLNEPVQTGFTQGHSVYAEGGDDAIRFGLGGNYKEVNGVMKGSDRKTYSGNLDFSYRTNKYSLANKFYLNGYTANESNYGSFSNFVNAPTYFPKLDSNGQVGKYLEESINYYDRAIYITNPLYAASLPGINNTKALGFTNNFQLTYNITPALQVQGSMSINQSTTTAIKFTSPDNALYDDSAYNKKGSYINSRANYFNYQSFVSLSYGKIFANLHQVTANVRAELEETKNGVLGFTAVGFPSGSVGNPSFSYGYPTSGKPTSYNSKYRRNNVVASLNYIYNRRYMLDATFREDGSTTFGSNRKYSPFWSTGIGWNLHNEKWFRGSRWLQTFRVRLNRGTSGNQNFSSLSSTSTYAYNNNINLFGQGTDLTTLGNPNIKWQLTTTTNLGTDLVLFKNRLSVTGNLYRKITNPLVVVIDLPSSTGLTNYPMNAGSINSKGFDLGMRYTILNNLNKVTTWNIGITAGLVTSKYEHFNGKLDQLNKQNQLDSSMLRYTDGYSPTDLWAVRSLGIDPGSGKEVFLKKNGQYTYDYSTNDIVRVGNTQPTMQGVISSQLNIGGFSASIAIRYSWGADIYNDALYNKVENITYKSIANNQDKRALYDRWKKAGEVSRFKAIHLISAQNESTTPVSSRFVERENYLSGESVNISYNFYNKKLLKSMGMESFRIGAYSNDFFRISTVKRERGTDYPFARSVSFKISATF
ncbi:TonB-linked outer membrane protein, SusC/RagA family [Filimonas lacunae]|uniref:TonB-linked outer membrane protein, SusC/RagA family n=1 Tax=Filimonas lacunae TaxID=477680 RepID=A0A173MP86_9BACT|nr:SusC/RagA family TonB-linked outer membrane protein [Filimonas lacunae]BAV09287.1 outer membrane protein [Filimonas lacunae]SIS70512.1 TonB-linked outer membrane protein, SusC/RagA family [Filimonas lacunae]